MSEQKLLNKESQYQDIEVNSKIHDQQTKGHDVKFFPISIEDLQVFFDLSERRNQNLDIKEFQNRYGDTNTFAKEKLKVDIKQGLQEKNVEDLNNRRVQFGQNQKITFEPKRFINLILGQLSEPVIIILLIAAVVSAIVETLHNSEGAWMDATGILCAVCVVSMVGASTEYAKDKQFRKLHEASEERVVTVIRDGIQKQINTEDLLVGDVVYLKPGDKIPADGILITGLSMKVNESSLTGEAKHVPKEENRDPFLISSTNLSTGCGTYLVCVVGLNSYAGKTKQQLQNIEIDETPLSQKLGRAAKSVAILGFILAIIFFIVLVVQYFYTHHVSVDLDQNSQREKKQLGQFLVNSVMAGICLIVIVVPEGWPLAVTLALAFSVNKMKQENNLVRHLHACETMGSANEVLSDKTGTLTQNILSVVQQEIAGEKDIGKLNKPIQEILFDNICINSNALILEDGTKTGNPVEIALLEFADRNRRKYKRIRDSKIISWVQPFDSATKMMFTCVSIPQSNQQIVYVKGAPENIFSCCDKTVQNVKDSKEVNVVQFEAQQKKELQEQIVKMGQFRVISFAYKYVQENYEFNAQDNDYTYLGYVCMVDPIRPNVPEAIKLLTKNAKVRVRMVTGDAISTATNVALQCGIIQREEDIQKIPNLVMTGQDFKKRIGGLVPKEGKHDKNGNPKLTIANMQAFEEIEKDLQVLARSTPEDKYMFVIGLKELKRVVAVTGDGTNDAQALKKSDVGFSMNLTGTEIAKEASDIVMLDDNFECIVIAAKWGRNTMRSVRKFLTFWMTSTFVFMYIVTLGVISQLEGTFTPVQIIYFNLVQDSLAALSLATERPTYDLLNSPPEGRNSPLFKSAMWRYIVAQTIAQSAALSLVYFSPELFIDEAGYGFKKAKITLFFNVFMWMNIFNLMGCRVVFVRSINIFHRIFSNSLFLLILIVEITLQTLLVEYGGDVLGCHGLTLQQHLICVLMGFLGLVFSTFWKLVIPEKCFSCCEKLYI